MVMIIPDSTGSETEGIFHVVFCAPAVKVGVGHGCVPSESVIVHVIVVTPTSSDAFPLTATKSFTVLKPSGGVVITTVGGTESCSLILKVLSNSAVYAAFIPVESFDLMRHL